MAALFYTPKKTWVKSSTLALPNMIRLAFLQQVLGEVLLSLKLAINDFWLQVLLKAPYTGLFLKKECEL